jgi:hypothetical protein
MTERLVSLHSNSLPKGKRFSILHDAIATLRAAGIQPEVRSAKGSHVLVSWHDAAGLRRVICVSRNSGEWHQALLVRQQLRRILKGHPA